MTPRSAHERYRAELEALADPARIADAVAGVSAELGLRGDVGPFVRTHSFFTPDRAPFATFVLEGPQPLAVVVVEAHGERPDRTDGTAVVSADGLPWLRVGLPTGDAVLASLRVVLAEHSDAQVVRYIPHRRCVLRVGRGEATRFVRVYCDDRAGRVHAASTLAYDAARRGELAFDVPRPYGFDARLRTLWQGELPGRMVIGDLLGPDARAVAHRVGGAVASLPLTRLRPGRRLDREAVRTADERRAARLAEHVPSLADDLSALLARLETLHAAAPVLPPRPVHGDLHAEQCLAEGERIGIVDLDDLALGDPERDVAGFLTNLEAEGEGAVPMRQVGEAFVAGYESVAGPLRPTLISAYRAQRCLSRALKAARSVHPEGDREATRRVRRGLELAA
jgi:Phosphotransferase enzyme family